jgi:hypothetical protein
MYPHERSLVKRLEGKPFALLGVNSDEDKGKLKAAMARENITWRSWWDGSKFGPIDSQWNVASWPTLYLIDAKGVIRHVNPDTQEEELDKLIDALVKEAEGAK